MAYSLGDRSKKQLQGVHPDLVKIVNRAIEITEQDFTVVDGLRTLAKQKEYVSQGVSKTLKSKHLKQPDGFGHAVDLYPYVKGTVRIDQPLSSYESIAKAMKQAAEEFQIPLVWGGDWPTFKDYPHYQLTV